MLRPLALHYLPPAQTYHLSGNFSAAAPCWENAARALSVHLTLSASMELKLYLPMLATKQYIEGKKEGYVG